MSSSSGKRARRHRIRRQEQHRVRREVAQELHGGHPHIVRPDKWARRPEQPLLLDEEDLPPAA